MLPLTHLPNQRKTLLNSKIDKFKFSFIVSVVSFLFTFFIQASMLYGQTPFQPCTGCVANDDHVESVVLVQLNPDYTPGNGKPQFIDLPTTCSGSTIITGYLKITFTQNANTRYGTSLAGNILVDGVFSQTFTYCDPAETDKGTFVKYISNFPITYTCGTKLELQDLFIGWGNSAGSNVCPAPNSPIICTASPHCEQLPLTAGGPPIVIVTPLSADFTATGSCAVAKPAQTYSFDALDATNGTTGGTLPYSSFHWTIVNKNTSVQVGTMTGANPSFDFAQAGAGPGVYTVTLTVTDGASPAVTSTISKDITVISCCNLSPPTLSLTQPTCSNANGTVTITAPVGADYQYSNGGAYQAGTSFAVAAGASYNITVKQLSTGCISSPTSGTMTAQPSTPGAPTLSIVQPTCSDATATITVTSSTTGLKFSFDGGAYADYPAGGFTTTTTGDHTVSEQNAAGCVSGNATKTVTAQPSTPGAPTLSIVQPTCSDATATITVTSSTTGLKFSFDGGAYADYPAGGFTTTTTGDHTVSEQNAAGCVSGDAKVTVNPAPPCGGIVFTYTQGFYHGTGKGCTPNDGSMKALQLMQLALQHMGGTLYLGKPGASFTVTYAQASKLQLILPGGGKATKLGSNYNLNSAGNYPPLKKGRINNVLLSQTITLALNMNIPGNGLSTFELQDGYLTTMNILGSACDGQAATCANGGSMTSMKITSNSVLMALLNGKTVAYLLQMASDALGGSLPNGVNYSDISNAVDVINNAFDEGRYSLGYFAAQQSCSSTLLKPIAITTSLVKEPVTDDVTVTTNPNPVDNTVNFTIKTKVSGRASLDLYNVMGVKMTNVYQGLMPAGEQVIKYNLPSKLRGTLIYTFMIGNRQVTGKIVRIK